MDLTELFKLPDMELARFDWGQDHRPKVYDATVLDLLPKPEWLIQYLVPKGDQVLVVADAGAGKTSLLLEWAWMLAERREEWWDYEIDPLPGKVLYLITEGYTQPSGVAAGIQRRYGSEYPEDLLFHFDDMSVGASEQAFDAALLAHWIEFVEATELQAIFVDTLNRTAGRLEENSSTSMSQYVSFWTQVQRAHQKRWGHLPTLLVAHHVTKSTGGARGSSALPASVDVVIKLDRKTGSDFTDVSCTKMKAARQFTPFRFSLDWAGKGDDRHSPVIGTVTKDGAGNSPKDDLGETQRRAVFMVLSTAEEPLSARAVERQVKALDVPISNRSVTDILKVMAENGEADQDRDGWFLI